MKQDKSLSYILPQALVLHEDHPASTLDFRILNRLMDVFYDNLEKRKISRSALIKGLSQITRNSYGEGQYEKEPIK